VSHRPGLRTLPDVGRPWHQSTHSVLSHPSFSMRQASVCEPMPSCISSRHWLLVLALVFSASVTTTRASGADRGLHAARGPSPRTATALAPSKILCTQAGLLPVPAALPRSPGPRVGAAHPLELGSFGWKKQKTRLVTDH